MKRLIIGNWKMNPVMLQEAKQLFDSIARATKKAKNVEVVICPPFVYLIISNKQKAIRIKLGGQDCFWQEKGAYTGEISPLMLKDLGCQYVIIGHSERRKYFGETDEMINKKLKAAMIVGLKPILCIGETAAQRKRGQTNQIIQNQLIKDLAGIKNLKFKIKNLAIAYEPVWAIGTGNPCQIQDARKALLFIQKVLIKIYNREIVKKIRIIYGGSLNSKNAAPYIFQAGFQGLLVGGGSLEAEEFIKIIKSCEL